jgi:hypothetical protein
MLPKLKSFLYAPRTLLVAVLCLVGVVSYLLGQSSVTTANRSNSGLHNQAGIVFIDAPKQEDIIGEVPVVASSGGTKYHKLDCPGADRIKESNKIFFDSPEQARAAGYTPAANCDW